MNLLNKLKIVINKFEFNFSFQCLKEGAFQAGLAHFKCTNLLTKIQRCILLESGYEIEYFVLKISIKVIFRIYLTLF